MFGVLGNAAVWIKEGFLRLTEGNTVFGFVARVLSRVPFELHQEKIPYFLPYCNMATGQRLELVLVNSVAGG